MWVQKLLIQKFKEFEQNIFTHIIALSLCSANLVVESMTGTDYRSSQRVTNSQNESSAASRSNLLKLRLPSTIRSLFDAFPWFTYEENTLPQRSRIVTSVNTLHVFALDGEPFSPNPACLKWQAYMMLKRIPFKVVNSNNHASPTGALPFILPAHNSKDPQPQAIVSSKIQRWVENQTAKEDPDSVLERVLTSLIEQNIRAAWLFFVYLKPENFQSVANVLYISPASKNALVQKSLSFQLQNAAQEEVLKMSARLDEVEILAGAERAFKTLETKLGDQKFFTVSEQPDLLDAAVFSYIYSILKLSEVRDEVAPAWTDGSLFDALSRHKKLIEHTTRVRDLCLANS